MTKKAQDNTISEPTLEEKVAALEKQNAALQNQLAESEDALTALSEQLAKGEVEAKTGKPTLKIGKDQYLVTVGQFSLDRKKYTAKDVVENKELANKLLKMESPILKKL